MSCFLVGAGRHEDRVGKPCCKQPVIDRHCGWLEAVESQAGVSLMDENEFIRFKRSPFLGKDVTCEEHLCMFWGNTGCLWVRWLEDQIRCW